MDDSVIAAMARWPNVPDAHGWLSLDPRGRWRLHPDGDGLQGGPGTSITNPRILDFIARNYGQDDQQRWFFQNGPQRVFVRLDAAPWIVRLADAAGNLVTHTGRPITQVTRWALDADYRLFVATDLGPAMVDDRYLSDVMDRLRTESGAPLLDALPTDLATESALPESRVQYPPLGDTYTPLVYLDQPAQQVLGWQ